MIQAQCLCKTYRRFEKAPGLAGSVRSLFHRKYIDERAVCELDLRVEEGEFVGLIGPNGAGKTTLVKMMTGIIAPTSGGLSVLGFTPNRLQNAFKRQYAVVMGQKSQLFFELTASDTFRLFREMYAIPEAEYARNIEYFVALFGVRDRLDVQVRTLSLGERMKMELIAALLHNPRVLFLDEPTIGLDAVAQRQMRAFLREVNRDRGTTILLTSHYMEDVRSLCPRSVVINHGRKLYDGDTASLFDAYQTRRKVTLHFEAETAFTPPPDAVMLERTPSKVVMMVPKADSGAIIERVAREHALRDIGVEEEDIGDVVERIYGGMEAMEA